MLMLTGLEQALTWHQDARSICRTVLLTARDGAAGWTHRQWSEEQIWFISLIWAVVIKHRAAQQKPLPNSPSNIIHVPL